MFAARAEQKNAGKKRKNGQRRGAYLVLERRSLAVGPGRAGSPALFGAMDWWWRRIWAK
jgi:hypothetical protein